MLNLQPFCVEPDSYRAHTLGKPFSRGDFTYATNGQIIIRVPRRDEVPPSDVAPTAEQLFAGARSDGFRPLRSVVLPPPKRGTVDCADCDGRGKEHDCPDCECECTTCHGTGRVPHSSADAISLNIGKGMITYQNAAHLLSLPNVMVTEPTGAPGETVAFRFGGGDGLLILMNCARCEHLDVVL